MCRMKEREHNDLFPLSDMQESYLVGKCMANTEDAVGCHIYCEIEENDLDVGRLNVAWNKLVVLHEMLRDKIEEEGMQYFREEDSYMIQTYDVTGKNKEKEENMILSIRNRMSHKVYQANEYPLYEICVTYRKDGVSTIHFSMDEWIADAASVTLLLKQWYQLYHDPDYNIAKIDYTYKNFMAFQETREKSPKYKQDYQYWMKKLEGIQPNPPWFFQLTEGSSRNRKRYLNIVDTYAWNRIKEKSVKHKVSPTATVLTCFMYMLNKFHVKTNTPLIMTYFNRIPVHRKIDEVVGPFITTMIFLSKEQIDFDVEAEAFWENVKKTQYQLWEDNDHNTVSGVRILRELKRKRVIRNDYTIPMVFTSTINNIGEDEHEGSWYNQITYNITQTPQVYLDHQLFETNGSLEIHWDVMEKAFQPGIIDQMFHFYGLLLTKLGAKQEPLSIGKKEMDEYPLTPLQRSYVISELVGTAEASQRMMYQEFLVECDSVKRLSERWTEILEHTPVLKYVLTKDQKLKEMESENCPIPVIDLKNKSKEEKEHELVRIREQMQAEQFPFEALPKYDLRIIELSEHTIQVNLAADPFIVEGKSLFTLYKNLFSKDLEIKEAPATFGAYIQTIDAYTNTEASTEEKEYWKRKFANLPAGPFAKKVVAYKEKKQNQDRKHKRNILRLSKKLDGYAKLEKYAKNLGCTVESIMMAAYIEVLRKKADMQEFTVVNVSWSRVETIPPIEEIVGEFTTMSWTVSPASDLSFETQIRQIEKSMQDDYAHKRVTGLAELGRKRVIPELPVVFTGIPRNFNIPENVSLGYGLSITPGVYLDNVSFIEQDCLQINWDYDSDVLETSLIEPLFKEYKNMLTMIMSSQEPDEDLIWQRVARQAERFPNQTAVKCGDEEITYKELDARSSQIARYLAKQGIHSESLVGICMEKSVEMIVAIVSILKAGGAYVALDPSYPKERISYIIEDSGLKLILTMQNCSQKVEDSLVQKLYLDSDKEIIAKESDEAYVDNSQYTAQAAYIIYTSGSTGEPKGVVVTHQNVMRLFSQTEQWYGFNEQDVWTMYHSFAFDFSVWEIWGALFYGGTLIVVPFEMSRSFSQFYHLIAKEKVTVLNQTPTAFKQLMNIEKEEGVEQLSLRYVIFGGEALNLQSLKPWYENHEETKPLLVNMYGITETCVHVTYRPIYKSNIDTKCSLIGVPIPDLKVYLLDENLNKVGEGETGEICVSGPGLARGYLNRPDITAERFIENPFEEGRLYLSGDLGRYVEDGDIEYMGRKDSQVKIRGFRIELGEIESVLVSHEHIMQAAVITDDYEGEKILRAFIITDGTPVEKKMIRKYVREKLPIYMVPTEIDEVDAFPMTVNGKLDQKLLKKAPFNVKEVMEESSMKEVTSFEEIDQIVLSIMQHELHESKLSLDEDIFDLGATSLTIVAISKKIQDITNILVPVDVFLDMPIVNALLQYIHEQVSVLQKETDHSKTEARKTEDIVDISTIISLTPIQVEDSVYWDGMQAESFLRKKITWKDFSSMLSLYQKKDVLNKGRFLYASAGGKNAVQVYVYVKENAVEHIDEGVYYYHPEENAVYRISNGKEMSASIYPDEYKKLYEEAAFAIFYIAELKAIEPVYLGFSSSLVQIDCGYMEELLVTNPEKLPLDFTTVEGIDFEHVAQAFCLQESHLYLGTVLGGASSGKKAKEKEELQYLRQFDHDFGNLTEEKSREINHQMKYNQLSKKEVLDLARKKLHLRKDLEQTSKIKLEVCERKDSRYLKRSSKREYLEKPVRLSQLSNLLALLSCQEKNGQNQYLYSSLGERHLIQTYVYVKQDGVEEVPEGIYRYIPAMHALEIITKELDANIGYCHTPFNRPQYKCSKFNIFLIADLESAQKEYEDGYLKYVLTEAGKMGQLLMDHQSDFDLGLVPIGGMKFDKISHLFGGGERVMLLHSFMGGGYDYTEYHVDSTSVENTRIQGEKKEKPIAVIGMSGRFPGADTLEEYWENLKQNKCFISELTEKRTTLWKQWETQKLSKQGYYAGWIDSIDQFDYEFFHLTPAEAKHMDPQERIMLEVVWECLERAGYTAKSLHDKKTRVGVFVGTMWGDYEKYGIGAWEEGQTIEEVSLHSSIANRISYFFDFCGPSISVQTACSSSITALDMACNSIETGECDIAIAGGVNLISHPYHLEALKSQGILATQEKISIYSDSVSGMAAGEGAGAVLLKKVSDARKDHDAVLVTIQGTNIADYGKTKRFGMVNVTEQTKLYKDLLHKCNLQNADIDYIEVAATGLAVSDIAELQALSNVFDGLKEKRCFLGSVKANIGHLESASFMAQFEKVILEMQHNQIVAGMIDSEAETTKFEGTPFRLASQNVVPALSSSEHKLSFAMINSFGAYGAVGSTIVKRAIQRKSSENGERTICIISARTWEQMQAYWKQLVIWLTVQKEVSIQDIAYTLTRREHDFPCKSAFVVSSSQQLLTLLTQLSEKESERTSFCMDYDFVYGEHDLEHDAFEEAAWRWIDEQDDSQVIEKVGRGFLIQLPTCPFQKKSCWLQEVESPVLCEVEDDVEEILQYVLNTYAEVSEIELSKLDPDKELEEYGFSSMIIMKFNQKLREDFQVFSQTLLFEVRTLRELAEVLKCEYAGGEANVIKSAKVVKPCSEKKTELAIIGLSGLYPGAKDIYELWENLLNKKDCIQEIGLDRWDASKYYEPGVKGKTYAKWGGFIDGMKSFDPLFFHISPREAELMDPQERKFLEVAYHTLEDAGYTGEYLNAQTNHEVGVFVGNMFNDYLLYSGKSEENDGYISTGTVSASISNRVSYLMDFHGPSITVNTMCSSALTSLKLAADSIQNGSCSAAIVGGVNLIVHPNKYIMHCQNHMLSTSGVCAAFGEGGDGFVPSEGVGAILIRPLEDAIAHKDHIYGVIRGVGINHDGKKNGYMVPNPATQAKLIEQVLEENQIAPESIQYVEAHGTGTRLGDPIEISGLTSAYQKYTNRQQFSAIGSIKANIGHCEGAAGIASITKVLMQMKYHKFAPNIHCSVPNSAVDFEHSPFYLPQEVCEWESKGVRRASVSSFGSGGSNGYAVLEEFPQNYRKNDSRKEWMIPFTAHTETALYKVVESTYYFLCLQCNIGRNEKALEDIMASVSNIMNLNQSSISKTDTFMELGFNIDDLTELKKQIEDRWSCSVQNEAILMNQSIQDVVKQLGVREDSLPEYTLENVAYTLLAGRVPMEEKVVFVCSDMEEFLMQMNDFLQQKQPVSCYRDEISLNQMHPSIAEFIGVDWFSGSLDMQKIDAYAVDCQKVSLPGYPFEEKEYWVDTEKNVNETCSRIDEYEFVVEEMPDDLEEPHLSEQIQEKAYELIAKTLKMDVLQLDKDMELSKYGVDSIYIMDLCSAIQDEFGVTCSTPKLLGCATCRELAGEVGKTVEEQKGHRNAKIKIQRKRMVAPREKSVTDRHDIAIIGIAGIAPGADTVEDYWNILIRNCNRITPCPENREEIRQYIEEHPEDSNIFYGGYLENIREWDPFTYEISSSEAKLMDPQQRMFLDVAMDALADAGYTRSDVSGSRTGVFVGTGSDEYGKLMEKHNITGAHAVLGESRAIIANRLSYYLNLHGPSETVDTACSSSLVALNRAIWAIRNHECSMAVAGGIHVMLTPDKFVGYKEAGMLTNQKEVHVFSEESDGFLRSEGVGCVILKDLQTAIADNDKIYGVVKGTAVNHSGKTLNITIPDYTAQKEVMLSACQDAGIQPSSVQYVEAQGTAMKQGDVIEWEALNEVYGGSGTEFYGISSIKPNFGHMESAYGIFALFKVLYAMKHHTIPALIGCEKVNPMLDKNEVLIRENKEWEKDTDEAISPMVAAIHSYGIGGVNAHLVVEEYRGNEQVKEAKETFMDKNIILLSAHTKEAFSDYVKEILNYIENLEDEDLPAFSYTLCTRGKNDVWRMAFCVKTKEELKDKLNPIVKRLDLTGVHNISENKCAINHILDKESIQLLVEHSIETQNYDVVLHLWENGADIEWTLLFGDKKQKTLSIPCPKREKREYWFNSQSVEVQPMMIDKEEECSVVKEKLNVIVKEIADCMDLDILPDAPLTQYGFDSIMLMRLKQQIEEQFKITISSKELQYQLSVKQIEALIEQGIHTKEHTLDNCTETELLSLFEQLSE